MIDLKGKKAIVLGDRDGLPGPAIGECLVSAGAELFFLQPNVLSELRQEPWT
jgi:betaine reductase